MRELRLAPVLAVGLILSACGGGDDTGSADAATHIKSYSVTGTDGVSSTSGTPTLDANQNGGIFMLAWSASAKTHPYRADIFISADSTLSSDDALIFGRNCDGGVGDCPGQTGAYSCTFDSNVVVRCAQGGAGDVANLSNYFANAHGLPGSYVLLLRVCDGLFDDCALRSAPVVVH